MKDIHNNPLFTDITPEEEVSVQGGAVPWQLIGAVATGSINVISAAIESAWNWINGDGNGIIVGDRKGSFSDLRRAGKGIFDVQDLPHGWNWGIKDNGKWSIGGYSGPKP